MKLTLGVPLTFLCFFATTFGFDLVLDTQKDSRYWKIQGNYFYAQSIVDGGQLAPQLVSDGTTKGVWYFKHAPVTYDNDNSFEMSFSLTHQLMYQVYLRMFAHPSSVAVVVKNGMDQEIASLWSSETNWCDAVLTSKRLSSLIKITVNLTEPESYVMIDKVILGVSRNISSLNTTNFNPCFESNPVQPLFSLTVKPVVEDMSTTETSTSPSADNRIRKIITHSENIEGDLEMTESSSDIPSRKVHDTNTTTTSTTMMDSVNCQCSCTCSKTDS